MEGIYYTSPLHYINLQSELVEVDSTPTGEGGGFLWRKTFGVVRCTYNTDKYAAIKTARSVHQSDHRSDSCRCPGHVGPQRTTNISGVSPPGPTWSEWSSWWSAKPSAGLGVCIWSTYPGGYSGRQDGPRSPSPSNRIGCHRRRKQKKKKEEKEPILERRDHQSLQRSSRQSQCPPLQGRTWRSGRGVRLAQRWNLRSLRSLRRIERSGMDKKKKRKPRHWPEKMEQGLKKQKNREKREQIKKKTMEAEKRAYQQLWTTTSACYWTRRPQEENRPGRRGPEGTSVRRTGRRGRGPERRKRDTDLDYLNILTNK